MQASCFAPWPDLRKCRILRNLECYLSFTPHLLHFYHIGHCNNLVCWGSYYSFNKIMTTLWPKSNSGDVQVFWRQKKCRGDTDLIFRIQVLETHKEETRVTSRRWWNISRRSDRSTPSCSSSTGQLAKTQYRSGMVNSNTVNSKFLWFFWPNCYHFIFKTHG